MDAMNNTMPMSSGLTRQGVSDDVSLKTQDISEGISWEKETSSPTEACNGPMDNSPMPKGVGSMDLCSCNRNCPNYQSKGINAKCAYCSKTVANEKSELEMLEESIKELAPREYIEVAKSTYVTPTRYSDLYKRKVVKEDKDGNVIEEKIVHGYQEINSYSVNCKLFTQREYITTGRDKYSKYYLPVTLEGVILSADGQAGYFKDILQDLKRKKMEKKGELYPTSTDSHIIIEKVNFVDVIFENMQLKDIEFVNCNFKGCIFANCTFDEVSFIDCNFSTRSIFVTGQGGSMYDGVSFIGCYFDFIPIFFSTSSDINTVIEVAKKSIGRLDLATDDCYKYCIFTFTSDIKDLYNVQSWEKLINSTNKVEVKDK